MGSLLITAGRLGQRSRYEHVVFHRRARHGRCIDFAPEHTSETAKFLPPESSMSPAELTFVRWLFERAALEFRSYRPETLQRRLAASLRALRVSTIAEARNLLVRDSAKIPVAVSALVIGVTSFFRDSAVFADLAGQVIPALSKPPHKRRIWSVGCSDGDEVYSLAVLLAEAGLLDGSEILATDCRTSAIARTRNALYEEREMRNVSADRRQQFFRAEGAQWRVSGELRSIVRTRVADITRFDEPGLFDLIVCRNMAMYLRPAVASRLWTQLEGSLRSGGFLVLGKAERPVGATRLMMVAPCIYRRN
jgi:chemotaxis methyl-accepting protein methylase